MQSLRLPQICLYVFRKLFLSTSRVPAPGCLPSGVLEVTETGLGPALPGLSSGGGDRQ